MLNIMKPNNYFILFIIFAILLYVLFYPWSRDMTFRFSAILVINALHGYLYMDKKIMKINSIISLILIITVFILGFCFDFFKYWYWSDLMNQNIIFTNNSEREIYTLKAQYYENKQLWSIYYNYVNSSSIYDIYTESNIR